MKLTYQYLVAVVLGLAIECCGAGQEFYQAFLSIVDTNEVRAIAISSPLLVDTNNTTPKFKNLILNLSSSMTNGDLGGVRLGTTMEGVVGHWDKPRHFWSRCGGGPRFSYGDVIVVFDGASNSVASMACYGKPLPQFEGGLSEVSSIADFIRVLGVPTARLDGGVQGYCELRYDTAFSRMRLIFNDGVMTLLRLDRLEKTGPNK